MVERESPSISNLIDQLMDRLTLVEKQLNSSQPSVDTPWAVASAVTSKGWIFVRSPDTTWWLNDKTWQA